MYSHVVINSPVQVFLALEKLIKSKWLMPSFRVMDTKHDSWKSAQFHLQYLVTLYLCAFKEDGGRSSLAAPVVKSCEGKEESGLGFTSWPVELQEWPLHASSTLATPRLLITLLHSQYRSWRSRKTEPHWDLAFTREAVELGGKNQVSFCLYDVYLHLLRWGHLPGAYYSYTYLILSVNQSWAACHTFKTVLRFC